MESGPPPGSANRTFSEIHPNFTENTLNLIKMNLLFYCIFRDICWFIRSMVVLTFDKLPWVYSRDIWIFSVKINFFKFNKTKSRKGILLWKKILNKKFMVLRGKFFYLIFFYWWTGRTLKFHLGSPNFFLTTASVGMLIGFEMVQLIIFSNYFEAQRIVFFVIGE